ncbi:unnamed protein product [Brachionus calyciflorus]|uniref:EGF-like domain-containing protein n=1 Tax=Brachionus calyciflorus TaxID=104777 RepID=A0A813W2T8_9BILA|nr:unnamed protein product [Brachionus calyciflorus]
MVFKEVKKVAYSVAFVFYVVLLIKHHCMAIETIIVTNENELPNSIKNTIVYIKFKDDPYQITDNLHISNNSMLIIEPGVIIKFISASKADIFIRNNSAIIVNGTSTDKVFIHSLNNLIVLENSTGQINFCELEYKRSIQIKDSNFKIDNSKLIDQYKLFSIDGSLVSMNNFISDSRIDIKYSDFFMENALFNSGSEIKLKYSRAAIKNLINSYPYSYIYLYGSHSTSIVNSSLGYLSNYIPYNEKDIYEFTNENYKFDSSSDWSKQNFLSLTDCKINGLLFDTKDSKNLKLNITSSYFDNYFNIKALRELSIENSTIRPAFSYSIFSSVLNLNRNTFLSSFTLNLDDQNSSSSVYINQNNFKSSCLIECLKKSNVNGVFEMKRNKFENVLYFNKCFNMTLRENSFLSQDSCLIKSSPFIFDYKEESLIQNDARYNYWNTNDFYIAQTKNCLFYENLLLNEFLLWPITNSSYHQILINQTNNEDSFILSKNQLKCGFLRNDLVLTKNLIQTNNSTKYYANYNIIVMPNVTLTLIPGIIISFAQNRGLIVLGNLIANGSSEEIQLTYNGESYFKWSGIDFKGHNFSHMYQSKSILENVSINNCNLLNVENTTKLEMKKIRSTNLNNLIIKTNYDFVLEEFRQEKTDHGSLFSLETTSSNASIILTDSNIFFNGRFSVITINKSLIIKNSYIEAYSVYLENSCLKNDSKCQFNVINSSLESKQSGINFLSNSDLNILNSNLTFNLYGGWYGANYLKISKPNQNQLKDYNFLNFYLIDSMLYANDGLFKTDNTISLNVIINSTKINTNLNNFQLFKTYNQLNTIKLFMYKCHLNTINIDFNVYDTTKFYLNFIENSFMGDNKSVISIKGQFKELIIKKNIFMNYLFSENFLRIFLKNYYDTNVEYMNIDISDNYFSNMKTNCLIFLDNNYQAQKLNSSLLDFKIYNNRFKNIKNYVIGTNMNNEQFDSSTKMLINASLNYWQTNFSLIINNNYLYNKYTNDLVGINVLPFYQDENLNVLNNDSSDGLFDSDSSSFIGGTLQNKNVRLMPTRIYTVIADIYIPVNNTLTLEAGVIINFLDRFHIYCSGNLIVNGNQTHLVVINLNTTNKENEEPFNLIEFKEESNFYGLSSLNYLSLNIYEFISGSVLLISTKNYSPKLNNIIISNKYNYEEINNLYYKENYGILLNNGNSTTQTLNINNISIFGFLNCFVVSFKIRLTEIIDSEFKNCIKYGVNANSNELIVKSSYFTYDMSTQFQGQQFNFLLSGTLNKLTIQDSKFFSSTMPSITKSVFAINSLESLIEKNSFVNVFVEFFQGGTNNKVLFIQNEYMFNLKLDESKIFSHNRYYYFDSCIEWTFENNTFSLNNSADLINLNLINSNSLCSNKSLLTINRNRLILKGDKFMNKNLRFFYINGFDGYINVVVNENTFIFPNDFNATNVNFPLIYIKSLNNITINQNAFMFSNYNFSSRDELRCPFQIVSKIPYALNGKYNYFGEKTSFILSECDHTSDSESYIDYYPFINYNKTVIDLDLERLYFPSYSIFSGGTIRNNLTIQSYNDSLPCQYTVLKNILIPDNVEVTIKPNCILKFKYNKRILLYGKLIAIGNESMPISFISENSTYWAGIYVNALNSIFDYKYLIIQKIIDNSYAITYTQYNGILSIENLIITYASNGIKLLAGNLDTIKIISSKMNLTKYSYYSQTNLFTFFISTWSTNLYIQNSTFSNFDLNGFSFKTLFLNNSYFYSIQNILLYIDCDYFYMKSNYFNVRNFRINFYLKSCNLINSREFSIENNHFNGYDKTDINILNLDLTNYNNYDYPNPASFILRENNFFNYALQINNARSLEFFNTLIISNVFESINALKNVYWYENNYQVIKLNIMQRCALLNNTIKNSTYRYGILLKSTNNLKKISIKNNLFVDNDPYLASNSLPSINLYISTSSFVEINQNIFTRSNKLDYDVGFGEQNLRRTNLTFNYWNGLNSSEDVLQRIFNPKSENAIIYEPFLTKASLNILNDTRRDLLDEFNCSSFSFCLNNGLCVGDNVCKCFNGYKGLNCSQYDCLNNCSNHGRCVDANVCSCGQGYFGNDCSIFTCQENCNNNGKCIELNQCQCNSGWSGKYCSEITCLYDCNQHGLCIGPNTCECNSSYTGKYCEIPVCSNFCSYKGKCIAPNKCKCNTGWSDEFNCEKCAYKFYGPDCQPITIIFSASPLIIESRTTGGVKIRGHNIYYGSQAYKCLFIDSNTNASISLVGQIVDDELLLCSFSDILFDTFSIGELNLRVHKGATIVFETRFRIFNNCTILSCGEREIPKRGYCRYGTCSCLQYYEGKDCEKLIYKPQFLTVNTSFLVKEFSEFKLNLLLNSSSTQPIELKLVKYPPNVELVNNSMVYWNSVSSNEKANEFIITATNRAGSDTLKFYLIIKPAYFVELSNLVFKEYPYPSNYILINGTIKDVDNSSIIVRGNRQVVLKLIRTVFDGTLKESSKVKSDIFINLLTLINGRFTYVHYPYYKDFGNFSIGGFHPFEKYSIMNDQILNEWNILGNKKI